MKKNLDERNAKVRALAAKDGPRAAMEAFGLSKAQVYRILEHRTQNTEHRTQSTEHRTQNTEGRAQKAGNEQPSAVSRQPSQTWGYRLDTFAEADRALSKRQGKASNFNGLAVTGLKRFGGQIDDDYDRAFRQGLQKRMGLFREMGDDPVCSAVLAAYKMLVRKAGMYVEPGVTAKDDEPSKADVQAAEFIEQCFDDMSQSRADTLDQAIGMVQYGFSMAELVYKRRKGREADPASKYDDGRIGWRKWTFLNQDSLAPGNEWDFDETGGVQGVNQSAPPDYKAVYLPIEKLIIFRASAERGNPEGRSILRSMWHPWYFKKNIEEIEAISAERMGAGFPVIYAGSDVSKTSDPDSDIERLKDIARNVRVDEQMSLVLPFAKMGGGAKEGEGVLFELISPPGKGADFHPMIARYEQRIAMVGLAQFMMLGMEKVGTQALAQEQGDFFTLAVQGFLDVLADTINRYAVERLINLNHFPGLTAYPQVRFEFPGKVNLGEVAEYVNKLVGAQVLTPGPELETYLREVADLPKRDEAVVKAEAEQAEAEAKLLEDAENLPPEEGGLIPIDDGAETEDGAPEDDEEESDEELSDEGEREDFAPNYAAKAGGVIAGNLGRGSGGKFQRAGAGGGAVNLSATTSAALRAIGMGRGVTSTEARDLIKAGLARMTGKGLVLTPAGREAFKKLPAAATGKGGGKGKAAGKGKAEKKGGGGGKADKGAQADAAFLDTAKRLLDEADQGIAQDLLNVLTKKGQPVSEESGKLMAKYGFVDRDANGNWILTARGRAWGKAAQAGDLGLAHKAMQIKPDKFSDDYALRGSGPGRRAAEIEAVNDYQDELSETYTAWSEKLARQLANAEGDEERYELLMAALATLLVSLRALGRTRLPEAAQMALAGEPWPPELLQELADVVAENDTYLTTKLIPAIRAKVEQGLSDPDIQAALAGSAGAVALGGLLATFAGRIASYAGEWWDIFNRAVGARARASNSPVRWVRDPRATHCQSCIAYGDKTYPGYDELLQATGGVTPSNGTECGSSCRCRLEAEA